MRAFVTAAMAIMLCACGAPADKAGDAPPSPEAAQTAHASFTLEPEALVGVWSFDRSCASGDGMRLMADGRATYDEWGEGDWRTADDNRVVLTLTRWEPGVGPTGETVVYNVDVAEPVRDNLVARLARPDGGEPRAVNAKRCPD